MNAKSIIREIKLSKLLNEPLSGDALIINNFFDNLFDGMEIITLDGYPNSIFFIKNGNDLYMEQNNKLDRLYCSNDKIWSIFKDRLGYNELTIKELIKDMVEEHLRQRVSTPDSDRDYWMKAVEEQLKQRVSTPIEEPYFQELLVEEQLKQRISTPWLIYNRSEFLVEEHLKQRVSTPGEAVLGKKIGVEEQLKQRVSTP